MVQFFLPQNRKSGERLLRTADAVHSLRGVTFDFLDKIQRVIPTVLLSFEGIYLEID